jgi:hypothetical protein
MTDGLSLGDVLMLLALVVTLYGFWQLVVLARYRGPAHGRGTPGYARARDARRFTLIAFAVAGVLFMLGLLTPFADLSLTGAGR